ncbi:MAG: transporter substrate-binding domain-containing protein [Hyphomicrobiaceae bacterium]|nr:transporter substrate-binding domain-containing protein [Hyphomicrobiaceae bacterium]
MAHFQVGTKIDMETVAHAGHAELELGGSKVRLLNSANKRQWRHLLAVVATGLALASPISISAARAQTCGTEYTIKEGETLGQIAARVYGDPSQWTVIFYSNQDRLGSNSSLLVPGLSIRLPCIGGRRARQSSPARPATTAPTTPPPPTTATATGQFLISSLVRRIEFLTADGYPPYTGRSLEKGGMLTELLSASMDLVKKEARGRLDYGVSWVNDWAAHLNPLLLTRAFDVGFPWDKPDCSRRGELSRGARFRCERFFFSDPIFEVVTVLYVRQDSRIKTLTTGDIDGAAICRPIGYSVYDFDQNGRNWLKDNKIILIRPNTVEECFRLLANGTADGVAIAELVGQSTIRSLRIDKQVRSVQPPVALTPLHVVVSKTHPHARTMLYYINTAVAKLRKSGAYDRIVDRHLTRYWEAQATPDPNLASKPAKGGAAAPKPPAARPEPANAGKPKRAASPSSVPNATAGTGTPAPATKK